MNIFSRYKKPGGYIFMSKYCKYIIIKDNELKILKTKRMTDLVKRELGVFDYRDYLFEEDLSIYLLVKDGTVILLRWMNLVMYLFQIMMLI